MARSLRAEPITRGRAGARELFAALLALLLAGCGITNDIVFETDAGSGLSGTDAGSQDAGVGVSDAGSPSDAGSDAGNGDGGLAIDAGSPDAGGFDAGGPVFQIGGTVTGVVGAGLVLQDNGGDDLPLSSDGTFAFATPLPTGASYSVTVKSQPSNPLQSCTVASATGVVAAADITNVQVTCTTIPSFNVGGTITGLLGQGLMLQDNGGDTLAITSNGPFTFATQLQGSATYSVTVAAEPYAPYQVCAITGGGGVVASADVSVTIVCTQSPTFTIGGTVTGLSGSGLVLQDDGVDDLSISANGSFVFATALEEDVPYVVTVKTQPISPLQTCVVATPSGVVGAADITTISINCTTNPSFTVGGMVQGLTASGLQLRDNAGDTLPISQSGSFTFATALQGGIPYLVSVSAQPSGQYCAVTAGGAGVIGASNITSVVVSCGSAPYIPLAVQITGLLGSGLVLEDNGSDDINASINGTYTFADALTSGQTYAVTIKTQPTSPSQTCTIASGATGTATGATVSLAMQCTTNPYFHITGTVTGLAGTGLVLTNNNVDPLSVTANGTFTFATELQSDSGYSVEVASEPTAPFQVCTVSNGVGAVSGADVINIAVFCTTSQFFLIGGQVNGFPSLADGGSTGASIVLENNGGNDTTVSVNGTFIFTLLQQAGQSYSVTVKTQPVTTPATFCAVVAGSGIVGVGNVLSVQINCGPAPAYTVGGTVTGLEGSGLTLVDNGVDALSITQNGPFTFATPRPVGLDYNVQVKTQPISPEQTCSVQDASGIIGSSNIANVAVVCITRTFSVGGNIAGLVAGTSVTLQDNGFDNRTTNGSGDGGPSADGGVVEIPFTFGTLIASQSSYSAAVLSTTGPATCAITSGASGTIAGDGGNVTNMTVNCMPGFLVSGTITGLNGSGFQLTNTTTGETITLAKAATTFAFARAVSQAQGYAVQITTQPTGLALTCALAAGSDPATGNPTANETNIAYSCTTNSYTVGGNISGLPSTASITLQDNNGDNTVVSGTGSGSVAVPFNFLTSLSSGAAYSAKVLSSTGPVSCSVTANATGTVGNGPVSNIQVSCIPTVTIGGTIAGYTGSGLQLSLKSATGVTTLQTMTIASASTTFAFTTPTTLAQGYALSVAVQPTSTPKQVCSFLISPTAPTGFSSSNITNIALSCAGTNFNVGGTVTGLTTGTTVTLEDNQFDKVTVTGAASGNVSFNFPTQLATGESYSAVWLSNTGLVSCAITSGASGTMGSAAVTSIQVTCAPAFSIAGALTTLNGSGLQLKNSTTGEVITLNKGSTTFTFADAVTQAQGYSISVITEPTLAPQTCALSGSSGSPAAGNPTANVTNIAFTCTNLAFVIGGTATGLPAGASVTLANGTDNITVQGTGTGASPVSFVFDLSVVSGANYAVTVAANGGPVNCSVTNGTGTIGSGAVNNITVSCIPAFFVSGTLTLYSGTGLQLKNTNSNETITIAPGQTSFAFSKAVSTALGYSISVAVQPASPSENCFVAPDSPSLAFGHPTANVTNISFICTTNAFRVGGAITGLAAGTSVRLQDNGFDQTTINGATDGTTPINFNFPTAISSGASYLANVVSTTGNVVCTITSPSGTVTSANITSIQVACAPSFTVAGTITNYLGSNLQLANSTTGEVLIIGPGKSTFAFSKAVSTAQGYAVVAQTQPTDPVQVCAPSASSTAPAMGNPTANVTGIIFNCTSTSFTIGGTVTGLTGAGLVLQDNGGDPLPFGVQTPGYPNFVFPTPLASGASYLVSVRTQPAGQICAPVDPSGTGLVGSSAVITVNVSCTPAQQLGGTVTGYVGSGLTISDGNELLPLVANGGAVVPFLFHMRLAQGQNYFVSVATQPAAPSQRCLAEGGSSGNNDASGTIGTGDDLSLVIVCGPPAFTVGGTVVGVANGQSDALVLLNNGVEQYVVSCEPTSSGQTQAFTFATQVVQGQPYSVTVSAAPSLLNCLVRSGSGTMGSADITNVQVICGFPINGIVDTTVFDGVAGDTSENPLSLADSIVPGTNTDPYTDSEQQTVVAGASIFAFNDPVPYGRSCSLTLSGTTTTADQSCYLETLGGCDGTPVIAPVTPAIRCAPIPAITLVPFHGATGGAFGVGVNSSGDVTLGGTFTGSVNYGHGVRVGSTFKSGNNKIAGSGMVASFDMHGYQGAYAMPTSANWDQLIPSLVATANNVGAAKVRAVAQDPAGDLVVAGSFTGSVDFGDGNGAFNAAGTESMFLARFSSAGAVVWAHPFGAGAIGSVAFNGTQIVAGGVFGTAASTETFGSKTGTAVPCPALTAAAAHRDFVAAFDYAAGGCIYSVNIGNGADPNTVPLRLGPAVVLDSAGDLIAAGNAPDTNSVNKLAGPYLVSYSSAGTFLCNAGSSSSEMFNNTTAPAQDMATGIAISATDAIYVAGYCQGAPKLQGSAVSGCNASTSSAFIVNYAPPSSCQSHVFLGPAGEGFVVKTIAAGGTSQATAIATDATGNVYVTGQYLGAPVIGGATLFNSTTLVTENIFFARFDAGLDTALAQAIASTAPISATAIAPAPGGAAWISGAYSGTVSYKGTTTLGTTAVSAEPMLVQFPQIAP